MPVERVPEWALSHTDQSHISNLLEAAFGDYNGRSYYKNRHDMRLVLRRDGVILSHLAVVFRAVRLGNRVLTIAGIGEVVTHPDYQNQGLASALVQDAITLSRDSIAEGMILFGTRPLYARMGFRKATNMIRFMAVHDMRSLDIREDTDAGLMILPFAELSWDDDALLDLIGPMF